MDMNKSNCLNPYEGQARRVYTTDGVFPTLSSRGNSGQDQQAICFAYANSAKAGLSAAEISPTLKATRNGEPSVVFNESGQGYWMQDFGCIRAEGENRQSRPGHVIVQRGVYGMKCKCAGNGQLNQMSMQETSNCLDCMHDQQIIVGEEEIANHRKYMIRRLTPTECARLQGFPDWWCDGVEGSDSAQYKMWGNGIALPCAADVLYRISEELKHEELEADSEGQTVDGGSHYISQG